MASRVTLKDIAREADVSVGLTSKALSGYSDVSQATQKRIQRISRQLGYRPPRRRSTQRESEAPGLHRACLIFLGGGRHDSAYGRHWVREFSLAFRRRNIRLEVAIIESGEDDSPRGQDLRRYAEDADGILLFGFVRPAMHDLIRALDKPCVAIGDFERDTRPVAHQVNVDKCDMARAATQKLLQAGHRRIGFLARASPAGSWNDQWSIGYRLALIEAGMADDPAIRPVFNLADRRELGVQAAAHMAALGPPPSAYVVPEVSVAAHFRNAMAEHGITIAHHQMAVGGDPEEADQFGLSGHALFSEDVASAATYALNLLEQLAQGEPLPPVQAMIPCRIHNLHALTGELAP